MTFSYTIKNKLYKFWKLWKMFYNFLKNNNMIVGWMMGRTEATVSPFLSLLLCFSTDVCLAMLYFMSVEENHNK